MIFRPALFEPNAGVSTRVFRVSISTWLSILGGIAIAAYFWRFSRYGLRAGFTYDDMMNLGRAVRDSYFVTFRDMVTFWKFSDSYRPFGSLFYRVVCDLFGFEAFPFRIACHLLMAVNLVLAYRLFRLLFAEIEIPLLGALVFAFRPYWPDLYTNTGFCYDLLCFAFYSLALLVYLKPRLSMLPLRLRDIGLFLLCLWLGLNSKEMIVSVPAILLLAELFWLDRQGPRFQRFVPLILASILMAAYIFGRVLATDGLTTNDRYRIDLSPLIFLARGKHLLSEFLSLPDASPAWPLALGFLAVAVWALLRGPLGARLALAIATVGALPVLAIPDRGLATAYIPAAGAAWLTAWALVELTRMSTRWRYRAIVLFAVVLVGQWRIAKILAPNFDFYLREGRGIARALDSARELRLSPPQGAWILMERDPFPESRWSSTFLFWILYRDPGITVDWAAEPLARRGSASYFATLTTVEGRLVRVR